MTFLRVSLILLGLFLLPSCTSTIAPTTSTSPEIFTSQKQHIAWINSLKIWEASGRFAVKQGTEGASGSFEWIYYSKDNYKIHFYGPFGAGNAYLTSGTDGVIWKDGNGVLMAETPEALIVMKTHYPFPVSNLIFWILGSPAMVGMVNHQQWQQGRLIYLEQAGWIIHYMSYIRIDSGELPNKIEMTSGDIKIKLIIDQWKVA